MVPNEEELAELCPDLDGHSAKADYFLQKGIHAIIVTLGADGFYLKTAKLEERIPAASFVSVDSTGACDAFISALASYLLWGYDLLSAAKIANYAAGFSITREGTIPALIDRNSLEAYLKRMDPQLLKSTP